MATLSTTQTDNSQASITPSPLLELVAPVLEGMGRVEESLQEQLRARHAELQPLLEHCGELSGKRLRPLLLLLSASASGNSAKNQVRLATCVEMIHLATLIHDDILDQADQRRHRPTAHRLWGNQAAVLLGDYLFTHSFYLASTTGDARACEILGDATNRVCEGELRQIRTAGDFSLDQEAYLSMIEGKTAALCDCSCQLGARCAGATQEIQTAMSRYGRDIGIAFQIMDDLLDIVGSEKQVGKTLGSDLEQVKLTLPLIHALSRVNELQRTEIYELVRSPSRTREQGLMEWYLKTDALTYTRRVAESYIESARKQLQRLPDSAARRSLVSVGEFILRRDH
ncbi:MAG: polyprenyl synthetase family protein [Planctomycetota bacterium]|nr:polyprenyl synthetase family protein [Planctomycetota bacterium]MDA1180433.1 polyprenyl synthetase family protein [Planctomycetota bacterium]